jgi:hypothetical protein
MYLRLAVALAALAVAGATAATAGAATLSAAALDCSTVSIVYDADHPGQTFTLRSTSGAIATITLAADTIEYSSLVTLSTPMTSATTFSIVVGGVTVATSGIVDCRLPSPFAPTRAADCKSGAWRSYGAYRGQGDCVSFVSTKTKNGPGGK